jgi:uracil-DNA glycosylase
MLLPQYISPSWAGFLTKDILNKLDIIEKEISTTYTPSKDTILRFLNTDLNKAKICIVGQDVYYQPGISTGRSFEVGGLYKWDMPFKQVSLKNIVRLIYKSYKGTTEYEDILKFSDILKEIKNDKFPILAPRELFESLEQQGVIFLNTYLTCETNKPNSHRHIWQEFSTELFNYISIQIPDLNWFLWGKEALSKKQYIKNGVIFYSRHPMLCSNKYHDDFLKSTCFRDTMDIINWLG